MSFEKANIITLVNESNFLWRETGKALALSHRQWDEAPATQRGEILYDLNFFLRETERFYSFGGQAGAVIRDVVKKLCNYVLSKENHEWEPGNIYGQFKPADIVFHGDKAIFNRDVDVGYGPRTLDISCAANWAGDSTSLQLLLEGYLEVKEISLSYLELMCFILLSRFLALSSEISCSNPKASQIMVSRFISEWCIPFMRDKTIAFPPLDTQTLLLLGIPGF